MAYVLRKLLEHKGLAAELLGEAAVDKAALPFQRGEGVPPFGEPSIFLLPCSGSRGSLALPPRFLLLSRLLPTSDDLRTPFILQTLLLRKPLRLRTPLRVLSLFRLQALKLLLETGYLLLEVVGIVAGAVVKHFVRGKQIGCGAIECKR